MRQIHFGHLSRTRPSTPCKSHGIRMYSALRVTCESKPRVMTRTHSRRRGTPSLQTQRSPMTRVPCWQMVDGATARATAPCRDIATAPQARVPARLHAHPIHPNLTSPSVAVSALAKLNKCVSRRARAAGAWLKLRDYDIVRDERCREAGGFMGGSGGSNAHVLMLARCMMWTDGAHDGALCACYC